MTHFRLILFRVATFIGVLLLHSVSLSAQSNFKSVLIDKTVSDTSRTSDILVGHTDAISHLILADKGNYTVSASFDQSVKIWHTQNGKILQTLVFPVRVSALTSSESQKMIFIAADSLYFYDYTLRTYSRVESLSKITSLEEDAQHNRLFIGDQSNRIRILSTLPKKDTKKTLPEIQLPFKPKKIRWNSETKIVAVIGFEANQLGYYLETDSTFYPFELSESYVFSDIRVSKNGTEMITGDNEGKIRLWSVEKRKQIQLFKGIRGAVGTIIYSPEEDMIAACGSYADTRLFIWNKMNGHLIKRIETAGSVPFSDGKAVIDVILFASRGNDLLSGNRYGMIDVWNPWKGDKLRSFEPEGIPLVSLSWSENGRYIAAGTQHGYAFLLHQKTDSIPRYIRLHEQPLTQVEFSKDGSVLMSSSFDASSKLVIWRKERPTYIELTHPDYVFSISHSLNDNYILTSCRDGFLRIWDAENGELLSKPGKEGVSILAAGFMQSDRSIYSYELGKLVIRDMWTGTVQTSFAERTPLWESSPDRTKLFSFRQRQNRKTNSIQSTLVMRPMKQVDKEQLFSLPTESTASAITVKQDNSVAAIALSDFSIIQIKLQSKKTNPLVKLSGHKGKISSIRYSLDGKQLASASHDGTIRIWNTETGEQLAIWYVYKDGKRWSN